LHDDAWFYDIVCVGSLKWVLVYYGSYICNDISCLVGFFFCIFHLLALPILSLYSSVYLFWSYHKYPVRWGAPIQIMKIKIMKETSTFLSQLHHWSARCWSISLHKLRFCKQWPIPWLRFISPLQSKLHSLKPTILSPMITIKTWLLQHLIKGSYQLCRLKSYKEGRSLHNLLS
jgi:hypothetical protein